MRSMLVYLLITVVLILSCDEKNRTATGTETGKRNNKEEITTTGKNGSYDALWKQVADKMDKGLPKSALKIVDNIYTKAKRENNSSQTVKALIHKIVYMQKVEEETLVKVQTLLQKELKTSKHPVKPLLHSMIAEQYWNYYQRNRYRFFKRTATNKFVNNDMRTWSRTRLVEEVFKHYKKSLENSGLSKKTKIAIYEEVLHNNRNDEYNGRRYRPTLYDFLAHRAVDFFMNSEAGLTKPVYQFDLNKAEYLSDSETFSRLDLATKEKLSFTFNGLKYLQELIRFHRKSGNTDALVDADLKRLRFVYSKAVIDGKDRIYEDTLQKAIEQYKNNSAVSEVYYELARFYNILGDRYKGQHVERYKWYKKKAHTICVNTIKNYTDTYGAGWCRQLKNSIESRNITLQLEQVVIPEKPFRSYITYRNIDRLYCKVIRTSKKEYEEVRNKYNSDVIVDYYNKKAPAESWESKMINDGDFQDHSTEVRVPALTAGKYVLLSSDSNLFDQKKSAVAFTVFDVSNITFMLRNSRKKGLEFHVLNRGSGRPLTKARVQLWYRQWSKLFRKYVFRKGKLYKVNRDGYFRIPQKSTSRSYFFLEFINGKDRFFSNRTFNSDRYYYSPYSKRTATYFFTDRSIYRPGQTVYFKGIKMHLDSKEGEKNRIITDSPSRITLHDVNGQKIKEMNLTTNEYGTFSGSFQLPQGLLNGTMTIRDGTIGTVSFSVEDYKRPLFEVTFDPQKKSYKLEDTVPVNGKARAFAGYNIDNAPVRYRVVRSVFFPYRWYYWGHYPAGGSMVIKNGVTRTDEQGRFSIEFHAAADRTVSKKHRPAFRYTVYADVTDLNGETRSSQKTVTIGYTALVLASNNMSTINKDNKEYSFTIDSTNLSGDFLPVKGTLAVYRLAEPGHTYRTRYWGSSDRHVMNEKEYKRYFPNDLYANENNPLNRKKVKKVYSGIFNTKKSRQVVLKKIQTWKTGQYLIETKARDRFGNNVENKQFFTLYSLQAKRPPYKILDWYAVPKTILQPGDNAVILVGSSEKNVRVLYEVEYRGSIILKKYITLNNRQKKLVVPIKEKHRGGIGVTVSFIRHNRLFKHQQNFSVPWTNKELDISFETFRNRLLPGEKEEWRIRIKGKEKDRLAAEMVATLYDESLDEFRPHGWNFSIFPYHYIHHHWYGDNSMQAVSSYLVGHTRQYSRGPYRQYDRLNWYGFYWGYYNRGLMFKSGRSLNGNDMESGSLAVDEIRESASEKAVPRSVDKKKEQQSEEVNRTSAGKARDGKKTGGAASVKARKNFNETAFFYPHLRTDKDGEIVISFTVPESLTRWKMIGMAHTKKLDAGIVYNNLVTRKELMVVPNAPRFLRENDTLLFSSKITNVTEKELRGKAALFLFDAATMKPVDAKFKHSTVQKGFVAGKGQSTVVDWKIEIPEDVEAVTYRVVASAGKFSDGEEKALPVLKNRMLVTESMPLPVRSLETKKFSFKKLVNAGGSKTLQHHRLTLEFTANPAWYAVQALPYIMEYPYECMEQTFTRYYANAIASHIVDKTPKIKEVFAKWKNTPGSNALLSNLHKNRELKSVLLEETPWVMQANNESERKKRIALLFDMSRMSDELDRALFKLSRGQMASGAWPWFRGMHENRYMTQHIIRGFAHLHALGVINAPKNRKVWTMVSRAVPYLDRQIQRDYESLIRNRVPLDKNNLRYIHIHYLYTRSYFQQIPLDSGCRKAFNYYRGQAKTYWLSFNKYMQGMIALALHRYDDAKTAQAILASIREHALYSEEMGMYWKEHYGYYWYEMPIESQALLIEAFSEITNDEKAVDDMKTWLIKSKQTQDWRTTKATADACYALLLKGDRWLEESKLPDITMGEIKIDPYKGGRTAPEAGTGYFKTSWQGNEIKPSMGNVTVRNNNRVVAWGAVYWQYFEQLDKITPHKTPLQLKKELFVEKQTATGPQLVPVSKVRLQVGDRLKVRIELRVDRSMEYVHMKDMRASGFEPENVISHYKWQDGLGYYESTRDAATNFFMDYVPKGTYVFEYPLRVTHKGDFSNGITTIQCMYAPEFTSHSEGVRVTVR